MLTKLVRIGRDAELRVSPNGTQVLNFSAAYDVGYGDNKKGQWIECAMFGKRAESLTQHFTKGKQIVIYADDVRVETYNKNDGTQGVKLKCKLVEFDFAGGQQPQQQSGGFNQRPEPQQQVSQQMPQGGFQQQPQQVPQGTPQYGRGGPTPPQQAPAMEFDQDIPF